MNLIETFLAWKLSIKDFEKGGYGSFTNTFRVPAQYKKYFTSIDSKGDQVYDKEKAFQEICITFIAAIIHRYKDKLLSADLFQKALLVGSSTEAAVASQPAISIKLDSHVFLEPQVGSTIFVGNLFSAKISNIIKNVNDPLGLTFTLILDKNFTFEISTGTDIALTNTDAFIYQKHTRESIIGSLYKGIQYSSINREFFELVKSKSFSGPNWSQSDQTSRRVLSNDIFGKDANILLENAQLNDYNVIEESDDNGNIYKSIYFKNKLLYSGSEFEIGNSLTFLDQVDSTKLEIAEGDYEK